LPTVDELWLGTFQRLCDATAHQFKGAMNGVAINLEVVRSRSARTEGGDASALLPFAEAAASELESVIESAEAMLGLARSPREPADVARIAKDLAVLTARGAATRGTRVTVEKSAERLGTTSAEASAVRLAIATVLLAAVERSANVVCAAVPDTAALALSVTGGEPDGSRFALGDEVVSAVRSAGVHLDTSESGATITFPR
jgi:hypothetical protein